MSVAQKSRVADWTQRRKSAQDRFQSLDFPKSNDEHWRFSRKGRELFDRKIFQSKTPETKRADELVKRSQANFSTAGWSVFANDELILRDSSETILQKQVVWEPLERAWRDYGDEIGKFFMAQKANLGSEKFFAYHEAVCRAGMVVIVPEGVKVELPLVSFHWLDGKSPSAFPHTLIIAEPGSEVTVVDIFHSANAKDAGFACGASEIYAQAGAKVNYAMLQNWGQRVRNIHSHVSVVEENTEVKSLALHLGGAVSRFENTAFLQGENARAELLSATLASGAQEFDQRTLQSHQARGTWSDLLFKNVLADESKTIFQGMIRVEPDAPQTDAYQTNRNLLLSPDAEADSVPGLEILNDEVKCSHGSTISPLSEEEMFYLRARGIRTETAQRLLALGFFEEVLKRLGDEPVETVLTHQLQRKFEEIAP